MNKIREDFGGIGPLGKTTKTKNLQEGPSYGYNAETSANYKTVHLQKNQHNQ